MGWCNLILVWVVLMHHGTLNPTPLDELTVNLKLNDAPNGGSTVESPVIESEEWKTGKTSTKGKAERMSTINFFFRGYNLMVGNPKDTRPDPDPGFKQPIFKLSYKNNKTTTDGRYDTPDGTDIYLCENCKLDFKSTEISGTETYQYSLDNLVKVDTTIPFEKFVAKFSASSNYQTVENQTSYHHNLFTQSEAKCCAYSIEMERATPPSFTENFLKSLSFLTDEYDAQIYGDFIRDFGTHYVTLADFGSIYGEQSMISTEEWSTMESEGLDIRTAASASAIVSFASVNTTTKATKEMAKTFHKFSSDRGSYTRGSLPPADYNVITWLNETKKIPSPILLTLMPIVNLLDDKKRFGLNVTKNVTDNLKTAYNNYCSKLKNDTQVKSCEAPGPDPGFPGYWQNWLTGMTAGNRSNQTICDSGTYVTWIQFIIDNNYGFMTDLIFGCSNGRTYNSSGFQPKKTIPSFNLTCNNNNGFEKIQSQIFYESSAEVAAYNVRIQCFDDSKPQYATDVEKYAKIWCIEAGPALGYSCKWQDWVACGKKQRMIGFQLQSYPVITSYIQLYPVITDIRFQCATFN